MIPTPKTLYEEVANLMERNRALERMLPDVGYAAAMQQRITELESTVQAQADTLAKLREAIYAINEAALDERWGAISDIAEAALEATK